MFRFLNWKNTILIIIIFIGLLTVINITKERTEFSNIEKIILDITAPLQAGWSSITGHVDSLWQGAMTLNNLKAEHQLLAENVRELRQQSREYQEMKLENERLRDLLSFKEKFAYQTVGAEVIGRNMNNWDNFLVINKGLNDGIDRGMAVITKNGLIGQTMMVTNNTAQVLLILDENSTVSGIVQETRENGMIEGQGKRSSFLQMQRLPRDAKVKAGDHIFSSGLGGVFPKGIFVGRVEKISTDPYDIAKKAIIVPAENFNKIEEVLVIVNNKPLKPLTSVGERKGEEEQ